MIIDPVVEQLHQQRAEYMERFHYDFEAIVRDIRSREAASPAPVVQPPPHSDRVRRRRSARG
jgi:hypothetical protein